MVGSVSAFRVRVTIAAAAVLAFVGTAAACPTCKDNLAHDPASANLVRGYAYSILFMLSMPFLILFGIGGYFYWQIRKARAALAAQVVAGESQPVS